MPKALDSQGIPQGHAQGHSQTITIPITIKPLVTITINPWSNPKGRSFDSQRHSSTPRFWLPTGHFQTYQGIPKAFDPPRASPKGMRKYIINPKTLKTQKTPISESSKDPKNPKIPKTLNTTTIPKP
jgi:hypothetical protein